MLNLKYIYDKLGTKDGEKDVYKLAKLRERNTRDLIILSVSRMMILEC